MHKEILTNIYIPGYDFIPQPSLSGAGGVGFYVLNALKYSRRLDLTSTHTDYEALWLEIQCMQESTQLSMWSDLYTP